MNKSGQRGAILQSFSTIAAPALTGGVKILSEINRYNIISIPGLDGWEIHGIPGKKQGDKTFM